LTTFLALTLLGLVLGCVYALTAIGIVVTYTTSGVFNFAHGATGMLAAFTYWQLTVPWGVPVPLALVLVLLVLAPLFGAVVERFLIRPLYGRSADAPLVATLGLLIALIGVSYTIWDPATYRKLPLFFGGDQVHLGALNISYHQVTIMVLTLVVGLGLRAMFLRTRIGIGMRAVVDNRDLAALYGATPTRVSQFSWALGSSLAALAGVLLAPLVTLDVLSLTLLIINAFAAALAGRLKNLNVTAAAAIGLQLVVEYAGQYPPTTQVIRDALPSIPMLFLFAVVVITRQDRLTVSGVRGSVVPGIPSLRASWMAAGAFTAGAAVLAQALSGSDLSNASVGMATAIILLSLVLLLGFGGQISLCQLTFVGLGALVMGNVGQTSTVLGIVVAAVVTGAVGVLVALPTLRLQGLYLALATLAFAQAMDDAYFGKAFGANNSLVVPRLDLPLVDTTSDRGFLVLSAAVFALTAVALMALRRSKYGRRLTALNDSAAACATLGIDVNRGKLAIFGLSAALAGVGGAFYGGSHTAVSSNDFVLLNSLALVLLLLVGGRATATGAVLSALSFAVLFPQLRSVLADVPGTEQVQFLATGLAVLLVARAPNGLAGEVARLGRRLRRGLPDVPRLRTADVSR
jgi:branched-chain amino acid transport system permease protein